MSIEKGFMDQGKNDVARVDINELRQKIQKNLDIEESFSEAEESERAKQNLMVLKNIVDNFLTLIEKGDLSLEDLKSESESILTKLKEEKQDIANNIKDEGLQRELFARIQNSYDALKLKAIGFLVR